MLVPSLRAYSYVGGLAPEAAVRRGPVGEGPGDHRLGQLRVSSFEWVAVSRRQNGRSVSCNSRASTSRYSSCISKAFFSAKCKRYLGEVCFFCYIFLFDLSPLLSKHDASLSLKVNWSRDPLRHLSCTSVTFQRYLKGCSNFRRFHLLLFLLRCLDLMQF